MPLAGRLSTQARSKLELRGSGARSPGQSGVPRFYSCGRGEDARCQNNGPLGPRGRTAYRRADPRKDRENNAKQGADRKGRQVCKGAPWVIKTDDVAAFGARKRSSGSITPNPAQQTFQLSCRAPSARSVPAILPSTVPAADARYPKFRRDPFARDVALGRQFAF